MINFTKPKIYIVKLNKDIQHLQMAVSLKQIQEFQRVNRKKRKEEEVGTGWLKKWSICALVEDEVGFKVNVEAEANVYVDVC